MVALLVPQYGWAYNGLERTFFRSLHNLAIGHAIGIGVPEFEAPSLKKRSGMIEFEDDALPPFGTKLRLIMCPLALEFLKAYIFSATTLVEERVLRTVLELGRLKRGDHQIRTKVIPPILLGHVNILCHGGNAF